MYVLGFLKAVALVFAIVGGLFWKLALRHNKNPLVFAIIGITSYYIGAFIGGSIITAVIVVSGNIEFTENQFMDWVGIPVGVVTCWLTYHLLKKNWSKPRQVPSSGTPLDAGVVSEQGKESRYNKNER